jgi:hypothetical protein
MKTYGLFSSAVTGDTVKRVRKSTPKHTVVASSVKEATKTLKEFFTFSSIALEEIVINYTLSEVELATAKYNAYKGSNRTRNANLWALADVLLNSISEFPQGPDEKLKIGGHTLSFSFGEFRAIRTGTGEHTFNREYFQNYSYSRRG